MLVNLSGKKGSFSAADFVQEYFNRLLKAVVEKKGLLYGDNFLCKVISRNLHHFACIKLDLRNGVGLAQHGGKHKAPHMKPEVQTLVAAYRDCELHSRRPGRVSNHRDVDDFERGMTKLRNGKLKKWVTDTLRVRNLTVPHTAPEQDALLAGDDENDQTEEVEEDSDEGATLSMTSGYMEVVDGGLVIGTESGDAQTMDWIEHVDFDALAHGMLDAWEVERLEDSSDLLDEADEDTWLNEGVLDYH